MGVRVFEPKIEAVGGLLVPASAAAGKILTSDASGNATWAEPATKKFVVEHSWVLQGAVAEGIVPGISIRVSAGNTKKLIAVEYETESGEAEFELRRRKGTGADAAVTGFTAITAKSEPGETEPAAVELASKDYLRLKVTKLTTSPKGLMVTAYIEVVA
jgi:hypothetical protein